MVTKIFFLYHGWALILRTANGFKSQISRIFARHLSQGLNFGPLKLSQISISILYSEFNQITCDTSEK